MKRLGLVFWLLAFLSPTLFAAPAPVTAEVQDGKKIVMHNGGVIYPYTLILKEGDKIVVSRKGESNAGHIPSVETFPAKYCGFPAQIAVLKEMVNNADGSGYIYDFLIFNSLLKKSVV